MSLLKHTAAFQSALIDWYATAQRPLPWRIKTSLYRTVVSELMAQQTQIKTMLPYFARWVQRFPDFESLAVAPEADVLKHWEGLGYYSRARNLHKLAKIYVSLDKKPETAKEWLVMPGIGPYTSAAIGSIAFDDPAAVVDGNVVRILARLTNHQQTFKNNADAVKAVTPIAERVLNHEHPGNHNQAMMELGATVCLKSKPMCTVCPVVAFCAAAKAGCAETIPNIQRKAAVKVAVDRFWILRDGNILLYQNSKDAKRLANQCELPTPKQLNLPTPTTKPLTVKKRGITNHRITESIHELNTVEALDQTIADNIALKWVPIAHLENITVSGPHRRWIRELLTQWKQSS